MLLPSCIFSLLSDVDFDPSAEARKARKERVAKNEKQHQQNLARAQQTPTGTAPSTTNVQKKRDIDRTLATTRISTASMGKFDKKLDGEKKLKGVKRKVSLDMCEMRQT
jgi:regulator of ribosome biosynthesis